MPRDAVLRHALGAGEFLFDGPREFSKATVRVDYAQLYGGGNFAVSAAAAYPGSRRYSFDNSPGEELGALDETDNTGGAGEGEGDGDGGGGGYGETELPQLTSFAFDDKARWSPRLPGRVRRKIDVFGMNA